MQRLARAAMVALLLPGISPGTVQAANDEAFAASRLTGIPATITTGVPVRVGFRLRNDGPDTTYTRATFDIPSGMLLAARPDGCFATFDPEQRQFLFEGGVPHGWERSCEVSLVARTDGSNHATFSLRLFTPPDRYSGDIAGADIIDPPTPAAIRVAGIGATRAGLAVLGLLALWLALRLVIRARMPATRGGERFSPRTLGGWAANAIVIGLGFLVLFATMAWDDWRTLSAYNETRCEILDLSFTQEAVSSASDARHGGASLETGTAYKPVLSLEYAFDGAERQSLGFSTDSRLSLAAADIQGIVDAYRHGQTVPCWVDPEAPRRVVVLRGFGGAYLFAPLPLLLLGFGLWLWPRARRSDDKVRGRK